MMYSTCGIESDAYSALVSSELDIMCVDEVVVSDTNLWEWTWVTSWDQQVEVAVWIEEIWKQSLIVVTL